MKTREIFNLALEMGKKADFREESGVDEFLKEKKEKYDRLSAEEKNFFDRESLENPYLDSRIHYLASDTDIKKIMAGIDIEPAEILLAEKLGGIDLVLAHHPLGSGLANLADVMDLQCDVLNFYGVPINLAEGLMKERISEVARGVNGLNHQRTVDAARLLGMNLMNVHTPADNLAARFLKNLLADATPKKVSDIIKILRRVPEYEAASKIGAGPKIFVGSAENRCGKIALTEITGGTGGSPKIYEKIANAGIGTIIGMHISEENKKEAEASHLNVVIAGHMSSDSLGMNLFLDELEKTGTEIISCSGLIRFSRWKKT